MDLHYCEVETGWSALEYLHLAELRLISELP